MTVHQAATATQPTVYVGSTRWAGGAVDAGTSLAWGIDARVALITVQGGEAYRPDYSAGTVTNAGILWSENTDWWTGVDHNTAGTVDEPAADPQFNYVTPVRTPASVTYTANGNSASWTLGVPELFQERKEEPFPFGTTLTPNPVPDRQFSFEGWASSQQSSQEWYCWNGGSHVSDFHILPFITYRPSPYVQDYKLYQALGVLSLQKPFNFAHQPTNLTLQLDYGWEDGATATSTRSITFRDQYATVHEFPEKLDANRHSTPVVLVGQQDKSVLQTSVVVPNATFEAIALNALLGLSETATQYAELEPGVAWSLGLGALKGYLLGLVPANSQEHTITKSEYSWGGERWSEWENPNGGAPLHSLPTGTLLADFHWKVLARPKRKIRAALVEDWAPNGYAQVTIRREHVGQLRSIGPRLWVFSYAPGGGGGGQGGENPG